MLTRKKQYRNRTPVMFAIACALGVALSGCATDLPVGPSTEQAVPKETMASTAQAVPKETMASAVLSPSELAVLDPIVRELIPYVRVAPDGWSVDPAASLSPLATALVREGIWLKAPDAPSTSDTRVRTAISLSSVPLWLRKLSVTFLINSTIKKWYESRGYTCYWWAPWWFCARPAY